MSRLDQLGLSRNAMLWLLLFAVTFVLAQVSKDLAKELDARWLMKLPRELRVPMRGDISDFMSWLVESASFGLFTFTELTRSISWLIEQPYDVVRALVVEGFVRGQGNEAVQVLPSLSWLAVAFVVAAMGHYAGSWRLAIFVGLCFLYLAVFGQWDSAMVTLSSILIAVPFGVVGVCCSASPAIAGPGSTG